MKATLNALVSSEKECPFDHSFFFFYGRNTKFRHATSANKQTDVDDGAVITALNNSGSFQKHFVKCKVHPRSVRIGKKTVPSVLSTTESGGI